MAQDEHAPCRALLGSLREALQVIAEFARPYCADADFPGQDIYERCQEALAMESGREAQEELRYLWNIAHHAGELYRPLFSYAPRQITEHEEQLGEYLDGYMAWRCARLWRLGDTPVWPREGSP